jgi:hypothetical protein
VQANQNPRNLSDCSNDSDIRLFFNVLSCIVVVTGNACTSGGGECDSITNGNCNTGTGFCQCNTGYGEFDGICIGKNTFKK